MTDPRIAPVEDNLLAFFTTAARAPLLHRDPVTDVEVLRSDVPFPMFNSVSGARFGDDATRRAHELVDSFVATGLPWMWWLTPSTTSAEIEAVLDARGLEREDVPGMYADLATTPAATAATAATGLAVEQTDDLDRLLDTLVAGFEMPDLVREPMGEIMRHFPETINVLASLGGRAVGCGTAYLTGRTAGLYNIATLAEARGRGVGYAVTVTLLELARAAGAEHAVLHSSEAGRTVYERAGFAQVCLVPQYVWMPPEIEPS